VERHRQPLLFEHHYSRSAAPAVWKVQSRGDGYAGFGLETYLFDAEVCVLHLRCNGGGRSDALRSNTELSQLREQFRWAAPLPAGAEFFGDDLIQLPAARLSVHIAAFRHLQLEIRVDPHRLVPRIAFAAGEPPDHPAI